MAPIKLRISEVYKMSLSNIVVKRLEEVFKNKSDPSKHGSPVPRRAFGSPSNLEKKLGVYLSGPKKTIRSTSQGAMRGTTLGTVTRAAGSGTSKNPTDIGQGIAGQQPVKTTPATARRDKGKKEGGFTRIRREDNPLDTGGGEGNRRMMVRHRKGQASGHVRGGGLKRLLRKFSSKTYKGDTSNIQGAITRKRADSARRLARQFK